MRERSKLGQIIREKGITQKEFAEMVFQKTGYLIAVTNLSNYCSGYKEIRKIDTAKKFAETLEVPITEIL
jgi:transcriptional regulator with XRE-family HTH domain